MKIIADGKTIAEGAPNMRQALFIASNRGECLEAERLEIVPETATVKPPKGKHEDPADTEK
jgi:hypothetical protein